MGNSRKLSHSASSSYCLNPGQEGGNAIANVLSGSENHSGKLPETFPVKLSDNPSFNFLNKDRLNSYKFFDFSATSIHQQSEDINVKLFIKNNVLFVELKDKDFDTKVIVCVGLGKTVANHILTKNTFTLELPNTGVYLVRIQI